MDKIALLAIDDVPDNLFILRMLLQEHLPDCEVYTATSGAEGLRIAAEKRLDGILLDVQMPEMDGIETCRRLKSDQLTRDIPVILITAHESTPVLKAEGLDAGAEDFIGRPVHNLELVARVRVMVRTKHIEDGLRSTNIELKQRVTERTQAQWESEERFRFTLKNSNFFVFTQDAELKYTWVYNPNLGLSAEEMLGKTDADIFSVEDAGKLTRIKKRVLSNGIGERSDIRFTLRGEPSFHVLSVEPLFDTDNNIVGLTGASIDFTDQKKLEDERNRLASVVEQVAEAIMITDAEGTIGYVNTAFEALTGYTSRDALGQHPRTLLQADKYNALAVEEIRESIQQSQTWKGRLRVQKKDESQRQLEMLVTVSPLLDADGEVVSVAFMSRDITHESELESQLQQSQKLDALGTLAGGIAHDFNNILGAIIGYTELAKEDISPQSNTDRYLKEVLNASSRAKELIQQILTFTRPGDTERKAILPHLIVKETMKMLRSSIPATIEMVENIEPDLNTILADPTEIHQIVMNLCTNGYQAMSPGEGTLTVTLKSVQLTDRQAARFPQLSRLCVALSVTDTGSGMDRKTIYSIFDPFFTTKKEEKGTGLGLSTVHGIVQSLGGAISVHSEPGKGSTFTVYLQALQAAAKEQIEAPQHIPAGQGEHILLVDDEDALRKSCKLRLDALGYVVTACALPSEALSLFEEDPRSFDLVLTDYAMPKMNGLVLGQELLRIRPDIPVILVTGFTENITHADIEELGLAAFLEKPIDAGLLGRSIREILNQKAETETQISSNR